MDRGPAAVEFGKRVRKRRDDRGWSQETLARETGLATVQISRIENGKREVRLTTILRLALALEISSSVLLDGIDAR